MRGSVPLLETAARDVVLHETLPLHYPALFAFLITVGIQLILLRAMPVCSAPAYGCVQSGHVGCSLRWGLARVRVESGSPSCRD